MPRVFLCDDESHYRSLVRVVLTSADDHYEVVGEASDGRECIALAPPLHPDLLLLDLNMPGMGGLEALPQLRALLPEAKIIALTTAWAEPWERRFLEAGGDAFIEKPRNAMTLPAKLRAALGQEPVDPLDVAELMFHTWWNDERARTWTVFSDEVEFTPIDSDQTVRGIAAMQEHLASRPEDERRGTARATKMLALNDMVVIEATAEVPRGKLRERFPIAWVLQVRDGKVVSLRGFTSWTRARETAGLVGGVQPDAEREFSLGHGWLLAAARRLVGGAPRPSVAPAPA
jgi:DNA-binding NarL/FixJ family response regulator